MGKAFEALRNEQKQTFRDNLARYGLDPVQVIEVGWAKTTINLVSLKDFKEKFGAPRRNDIQPPPIGKPKSPAKAAEDYIFHLLLLTDTELDFIQRRLGPFQIKFEAAPDITITPSNPLVLEGGAEVREYGTITIEPGGQIIIRNCLARISCQRLEQL